MLPQRNNTMCRATTHFVNCLERVSSLGDVYVLKDNRFGLKDNKYMHSKYGLLAFMSYDYMDVVKTHIKSSDTICRLSQAELVNYIQESNTNATVIYNSYCDVLTQTTYFLYFDISPNALKDIA